ncbi:hypothetical protein [Corallococcus sp. AS-1-6]|uniref:hypothetical protein n=1 Tax=Corallococcus sp. AS-1-6 TaxID=2874599 RepID=UPI001CBDDA77|nr:hypothetical protein [Corallococcus sp. AS-1-6]MBZ4373420.1 hypothetical protein [Corallococcus sp. AS-1-6]
MQARSLRSCVLATLSALSLLACGGGSPEAEPVGPEATERESVTQASVSCVDECYQSYSWCPAQCQATYEQCAAAISICYDSCDRGVGPWLPC